MTTIEAIRAHLKLANSVTVSQIAKAVNKQYRYVLKEIADNAHLLLIDRKSGKIIGLKNVKEIQINNKRTNGGVYWEATYYDKKTLETRNIAAFTATSSIVYTGIYREQSSIILDTPENRKILEAMGVIHVSKINLIPIEDFWNQPIKCRNHALL